MANTNQKGKKKANGANLGFESTFWAAADKLRSNMDAAEYKHVVLGLIFLKYISDAFEGRHRYLKKETANPASRIADTYHAWRGDYPRPTEGEGKGEGVYEDIPGFCKSATLDDIRSHGHVLTPGRYVGAAKAEDDGEPFEKKMERLTATLKEQCAKSVRLNKAIWTNLKELGYGK